MQKQYVIDWTGEPVNARYVRLMRLESPKTNWASVRTFDVNPVSPERLGFSISADDMVKAMAAFDKNVSTAYTLDGSISFGIPEGTGEYVILFRHTAGDKVSVVQKAADGTVLNTCGTGEDFFVLKTEEGAAAIEISGNAEIFEIIAL